MAGYHIFLSYSRRDSAMMQRISATLREQGLKVWTDENLSPGTPSWKDGIQDAIENSQCLIALLSPDFKASEWCERELDYARALKPVRPIFPVLVRGDESDAVPFELMNVQRLNLQNDYLQGMANLLEALTKALNLPATPLMAEARQQRETAQKQVQAEQEKREKAAYEQRIQAEVEQRLRDKDTNRAVELAQLGAFFDFDRKTLEKNRAGKLSFKQQLFVLLDVQKWFWLWFALYCIACLIAVSYLDFIILPIVSIVTPIIKPDTQMSLETILFTALFSALLYLSMPFVYLLLRLRQVATGFYQRQEVQIANIGNSLSEGKLVLLKPDGNCLYLLISKKILEKTTSYLKSGAALPFSEQQFYTLHYLRHKNGQQYFLSIEP